MQTEKKHLEILLIQYFKEYYNDFPKGLILPSESPDFVVQLKSLNILGIEITRLNPGNAEIPNELLMKKNEFRNHFIEIVKELVEKDIPHHLFVKFLFSEKQIIREERKLMAAIKTANVIRKATIIKSTDSFFKLSIPSGQLPSGIDEILLVNHPIMQTSIWERSNNLGISNNVLDDIRTAIHKKDEKLRIYQKQRLNFYWLLIVTDRLRGVKSFNLANKIMNHKFHSNFQRVFLFDLVKSKVYVLV